MKVTLQEINNVIREIKELFALELDSGELSDLRNIIGDFGVEQYNKGLRKGAVSTGREK